MKRLAANGKQEKGNSKLEIGNWAGKWQPTADGHSHELAIKLNSSSAANCKLPPGRNKEG